MAVLITIGYVILAICVLLIMVLIHEFGHYCIGRWLGFKITEFSIGFGKAIFSKVNKRGEKISLRIFPLGGYCAFAGEGDDEEEQTNKKDDENSKVKLEEKNDEQKKEVPSSENLQDSKDKKVVKNEQTSEIIQEINNIAEGKETKKIEDKSGNFINHKPWKRLLVYMAGVTFNFLSAILFSFILLISYGIDIPKVAYLNPDYTNLYQDLQVGDVIWKVNDTRISFAFTGTFDQLIQKAIANNEPIKLTVERNGEMLDVNVDSSIWKNDSENDSQENQDDEVVLMSFETYAHHFWEALGRSFELAFGFAWVVLKGFWQIITGQIEFSQLGGSISTIGMMSEIMQSSFANFLILLPLLASNLAVFNFLPIPALDGGHAVFTLLEWIFGKPVVSRKVENYIHFYGLIVLLLFVVVVDIVHIAVVGL